MSTPAAELLFRPRSVVVYGASSDPEKLSGRPLDYLKKLGYAGDVYAVNPRRTEVQGVRAYADVASVPGPVDLAIVVVPAEAVVDSLRRCAEAGVRAAIVFASGFAEIGGDGASAQEQIADLVRRTGMRVLGPNCLGSFSASDRTFATFSTAFDEQVGERQSPIALVSQSGAVGTFTYSTMTGLGLGVRYFANSGNEVDITTIELLTALVDADDVELLLGHLEGGEQLDALQGLAQAAQERGKPLVVLKGGRTPAGSRAVAAHTASVAGNNQAFDRILHDHGAIRVPSMEALADTALAFASGRRARGRRLTIVTQSGGAGALAADAAVALGLTVEPWAAADRQRLAPQLPYFASTENPIDVTGAMINDTNLLATTLEAACENDDTDAVLVIVGNSDKAAAEMVGRLEAAFQATSKPFVVAWTGGSGRPRAALLTAGVPTFPDPHRAVGALAHVIAHSVGRS